MRHTVRAALAVALLAGFYVLAFSIIVGSATIVALVLRAGITGIGVIKLVVVLVFVTLAIGRALMGRRRDKERPDGVVVTDQEQPTLWAEVRELSAAAGTRPPDEIRLVAAVNAGVTEDARLLGLVPGRRRLYVGVPLMLALSPLEMRSVLAHELGHYSGRHTALAPVTYRGKEAIGRAIHELGPGSLVGRALRLYGRLYLAVAHSVSRRQELEADELSVQLAGRNAAVSSLSTIGPLDAAWEHFLRSYATLGEPIGRRPTPLFEGFSAMLEHPEVLARLAEVQDEEPHEAASVYDTHPPVAERIARLMTLPDTDPGPTTATLLDRPADVLAAVEADFMASTGWEPAPWDEVVAGAGAALVARGRRDLAGIAGSAATFGAVAARLKARGPLGMLRDHPAAEERQIVATLLGDAVADELVRNGAATFSLDWARPARLTGADGGALDPWSVAELLEQTNDPAAFGGWLTEHGLDVHASVVVATDEGGEGGEGEQDALLGVVCPVMARDMKLLVVTDRGISFVRVTLGERLSFGLRSHAGAGASTRGAERLLRRILATPLPELWAGRGTRAYAWDEIVSAVAKPRRLRSSVVLLTFRNGRRRPVRFDSLAAVAGSPWETVARNLGDRFLTQS